MAENEYSRTDRVYIDATVADVYGKLRRETNMESEQAPFETYKDLFMLAACLGFREGRRVKPKKGSDGSEIPTRVFTEDDLSILKTIAVAETGDVQVLERLGEILGIAEEYAHVGIREVQAYLLDERGRPLWNLISLLQENKPIGL